MQNPWAIVLVLVLVLAAAASPAFAEDPKLVKIDNPEFASWSKFKAGSSVTIVSTSDFNASKTTVSMTTKLVEVAADKAVVETESVTTLMGKEFKVPAQKREVPKSIEVNEAMAKAAKTNKPEGTFEEGTETLKVGGAEVKTKWQKYKSKVPNLGEVEGQIWTSEEVPGLLVKSVSKADKFESKLELTEFTKK